MTEFSIAKSPRQAGTKKVVVFEAIGELDAHTFPVLQREFDDVIDREAPPRVVVDCARLDYVSSAGLGVLRQMTSLFRQAGGDVRLAALQPKITTVMNLLGLTRMIRTFESVEQALDSFKA